MSAPAIAEPELLREIERFLFCEARLADEHAYEQWEALWTEDAVYWVPAGDDHADPEQVMSIIYDNRSRIAKRIKQLKTGKRHAQNPRSRLRRLVSNIELEHEDADDLLVAANFIVFESRDRGTTIWAGRTQYRLRRTSDGLRLAAKKVMLADNDRALSTLAFLI